MAGDEHGFIFMYYVRVLGELFWGACVDYMCLLGDDRCVALWCYAFVRDDLMMRGELELPSFPSSAHLHVMIEGPCLIPRAIFKSLAFLDSNLA